MKRMIKALANTFFILFSLAHVGERTTIGAGSVVTKPIPARSVAVGIPATVIKSVD
jgi:acetyltransferase-like isoleucine patch superfamily enzyme